jgi:carbamoyl-phosphate synthase large subunit
LPKQGTIFMSFAQRTKHHTLRLGQLLHEAGFQLMATSGTAKVLSEAGIPVRIVKKVQEGHPNLIDHLINGDVQLIFNTPSGKGARTDEGRIRAASVSHGVPCITTIQAADAAVRAMQAMRDESMGVQALQDRFPAPTEQRT